jgi:putative ABC transport system permease protein
MRLGTRCFEDPSLLDERERFRALSTDAIAEALPMVIEFAQWRLPSGGTTPVFIVGSDARVEGLHPRNLLEGSLPISPFPGLWQSINLILIDSASWGSAPVPRLEIRRSK